MEVFDEDVTFSDKNDLLRVDDVYNRKPVGYESSVQIESSGLERYNYFSFHSQKKVNMHSVDLEIRRLQSKEDLTSLQEFQHIFLLNGVVSSKFQYIKEGSLLDPETLRSLVLPQEADLPVEVLALKKVGWKEDHKIIYSKDHLTTIVKQLKQAKESIVLTSGCFDILHVGHIHTLKSAKQLGTKLIVCLSSDEQIQQLKGPGRPINNNEDRLNLFKIIEYVDYIYPYQEENIQEEQTLGSIMKVVDPDVWVKGSDYTKETILSKHPYLRKIAIVDLVENKSTTNIIKKISDST
jgi:D-beta-D-heptose 7-phosphate kinase/D-beta-D-heptose 1-phosphate adenosyltransferase